jgi:hypothetical protein
MTLEQWAIKWGVPYQALQDLRTTFGTVDDYAVPVPAEAKTEGDVQNLVRLEASRVGARLWRNNVGAYESPESRSWVRYGLANDTKAVNKKMKSSDLIGIRPVSITMAHVGMVLGQFVAREVKEPGWGYKGTEHERAQLKFIELVTSMGGDAAFANNIGTM